MKAAHPHPCLDVPYPAIKTSPYASQLIAWLIGLREPCLSPAAGKEVASALLGTNGEVQQLPSRRASTEPPAQSASHSHSQQPHSQATPPRATSPARSISPQPGPSPLAWLPATAAALALRLYALDASLIYGAGRPPARDSLQVRLAWVHVTARCLCTEMGSSAVKVATNTALLMCSLLCTLLTWSHATVWLKASLQR